MAIYVIGSNADALQFMDKLALMEIFVRIVDTGSFSAVARELRTTQPTVSKQMTSLEQRLNTRLLNRSTRRLSLTAAGGAYYERCRRVIAQVQSAESNLGELQALLSGTLAVNSSVAFGQMFLTALVLEFQKLHPEISVDLTLNDRYIDLVEEGIDVALRFGRLVDSSLIARRLASSPLVVVAAPAYLQKHGIPQQPDDLTQHSCLRYTYLSTRNEWVFPSHDGEVRVRVAGKFRSNNGYALRDAMLAGHGIAVMPVIFIQQELRSGKAVPVLQAFAAPPLPVNAVYPSGRFVSAKVRGFIDFLQQRLPQTPGLIAS